jgi:diguanylate cyclase (GGDEF)-like protein
LLTFLGVALVGVIDFASGVELRVGPLYYLPLSLAAWRLGRAWTAAAAGLCAASWVGSNYMAGLTYSNPRVWLVNVVAQGASFMAIGLLIATLKGALVRERELSRTDPLTSLLNGRAFYADAARVVALNRRTKRPATVACIDLDHFKKVNDTAGHHEGDRVLRAVADTILRCTRATDLAARMGGDEFVLLLPETGPQEARTTLERLQALLEETLAQTPGPVTASVGGVSFLAMPDDVQTMVQAADRELYAAKAAGKRRVQLEVVGGHGVAET